jgi:alpha-ketoglutarate-dependent 2,4-dichlorophenoxyacetate dioxygenase
MVELLDGPPEGAKISASFFTAAMPRRGAHMAITIVPITPDFVAEVGDIDLSRALSHDDDVAIKQAFWDYAVLIFPGQQLTQAQQLRFAESFGPLESNLLGYNTDAKFRIAPALIDISNLTLSNEIWSDTSRLRGLYLGNQLWHTDSSFKYVPAFASMLYAHTVAPIGGHTEFADMRAAYAALPVATQARIEGLVAEHSFATSRAKTGFTEFTEAERANLPPVPQMLVRTLPESGRKTLYLASHIGRLYGLSDDEGATLVADLMAHATQRQFMYVHRWREQDLVLWDNRCTMHRGTGFDDRRYVRDMHRATVSDRANSCAQAGIMPRDLDIAAAIARKSAAPSAV